LETVAQKYDEMPAIQEALAIVQADIAELREAIAALEGNKGKDGVVGRKSKRLP
jgi:prefoldin subunit 5